MLLHPLAGVLSAYGMGLADVRSLRERSVGEPLASGSRRRPRLSTSWPPRPPRTSSGRASRPDAIVERREAHLKYEGTDVALEVPWDDAATMEREFLERHRKRYGFLMGGRALVIDAVAVEAIGTGADPGERPMAGPDAARADVPASRRGCGVRAVYTAGAWHEAPIVERERLRPGARIEGPAIVREPTSTIVVEPGWAAELLAGGELLLRRGVAAGPALGRPPAALPAAPRGLQQPLHVDRGADGRHARQHRGLGQHQGAARLQLRAVRSGGGLVANAPHLPVHLGSMGASVRAVLGRHRGAMQPGDAYLLNSPYAGGTHLPDLTVVTPCSFTTRPATRRERPPGRSPPSPSSSSPRGRITPTSAASPPGRCRRAAAPSTRRASSSRTSSSWRAAACAKPETAALLTSGRYPVRDLAQNLGDLRAQVAANARGVAELERMVAEFGLPVVRAYMQHVQDNAEEAVRRVIHRLGDGSFRYQLDDGAEIRVAVRVDHERGSATVDFTGTSRQRDDNFNAPPAVCTAAVLYVFRALIDADIPLNSGCLKPLRIVVPPGSMLDPASPAAVAAGNVETSQAITGALLGRPRRGRLQPGHDEQRDLRRRALPVLRDDLRRRRGPGPPGTAAAPSTPT